ncbi:16874_t:CDS:2, partial [Funneliformis geosporum]
KTYGAFGCDGCHPTGIPCNPNQCGAQVIDANLLPNSVLNITVRSPSAPTGFGHFIIGTDYKQSYRFFTAPRFVNGADCNLNGLIYTFTSNWAYDFPTPPGGTWFDIWISVYWNCGDTGIFSCGKPCISEDIHHR